ncbi:MAG: hypothetical protein MUF61_01155 [archaeon]|jgi:hypothetical protein|nr:hypothetical protein [archaeon]
MEKDIGRIQKNSETDVLVRIDDFGGRVGVTIREFVKSERYTGFTKAGTRISAENFPAFKELINSIDEKELAEMAANTKATQSTLDSSDSSGKKEGKTGFKKAKEPDEFGDAAF